MKDLSPKWPERTLGEVTTIVSGSTPKTSVSEYWDGDILWATPRDLSKLEGVYISDTERKITKRGYESCSSIILPPGAVLFSSRAPIGHVAIAEKPICTNQGFKSFICSDKLFPVYLYYYLRHIKKQIQQKGRGATFTEVSKTIVSSIMIPLPPIPIQQETAAILEQVESARKKRREANHLTDELLKSTFIEMFGDPIVNSRQWLMMRLGEVLDVRDGTHDTPKYINVGIPLITSKNLKNGIIDFENVNYISKYILYL